MNLAQVKKQADLAVTRFWGEAKKNQPEIVWHYDATKILKVLEPLEYEGKDYQPGQFFYPPASRAPFYLKQNVAVLEPGYGVCSLPVDLGSVSVYYPRPGVTRPVPAYLTWPGFDETEPPPLWDVFYRVKVLRATPALLQVVPLPTFWSSESGHEFFLNLPTITKLGYTVEGIDHFGDPLTAAVCAFDPQIPAE